MTRWTNRFSWYRWTHRKDPRPCHLRRKAWLQVIWKPPLIHARPTLYISVRVDSIWPLQIHVTVTIMFFVYVHPMNILMSVFFYWILFYLDKVLIMLIVLINWVIRGYFNIIKNLILVSTSLLFFFFFFFFCGDEPFWNKIILIC